MAQSLTTTTTLTSSMGSFLGGGGGVGEDEVEMNLGFHPQFTSLRQKEETIRLQWNDLKYTVGKRIILNSVSGEAAPEEIISIMGPSGAGKTTLLNTLAGRVSITRKNVLSGSFRVNGVETRPSVFRKRVAYVSQDDSLFATSTCREALEFSARLRLPSDLSKEVRDLLVNDMIQSLGLTKCADTMVGSELVRGLSGGERKRVAIGVELVSNPSCLFLDEPTSGLDSFSAWKVLRILKAISKTGCTILCSIHQPSTEVFNEFSHLILLGSGNIIFQGALKDIDVTFRAVGLGVPPNTNPADHLMFLVQTRDLNSLPNDNGNARRNHGNKPDFSEIVDQKTKTKGLPSIVLPKFSSMMLMRNKEKPGVFVQSAMLAWREFVGIFRDRSGLIARFGGAIFLSVLIAVLFLGAADQSKINYSVNTHFGSLVMVWMLGLMSAAQPALLTFPIERVVFIREKATGTYGVGPYMFSKLILELPLMFIQSLVVMLIVYWSVGFNGNFFFLVLSLWANSLTGVSTAYVIGALAPNAKAAMEIAPVILVPQMLFLGLFIRIEQMPIWVQWAQWLVGLKYSIDLAMVTEFDPSLAQKDITRLEWAGLLSFNNVSSESIWFYGLMIAVIFSTFRVLSLFILNEKAKRF